VGTLIVAEDFGVKEVCEERNPGGFKQLKIQNDEC